MTAEFWITTAAIIVGPIAAVLIAQWLQIRHGRVERRLWVLRALMSSRRTQLSPERVNALNLVDIEFSDRPRVLRALQDLLAAYNDRNRWLDQREEIRRQLLDDVDERSVRLIQEIARSLGYKIEQLEILRGGYYPEAFGLIEEQQKIVREFLVGLRSGQLVMPVAVLDYTQVRAEGDGKAEAQES